MMNRIKEEFNNDTVIRRSKVLLFRNPKIHESKFISRGFLELKLPKELDPADDWPLLCFSLLMSLCRR